MADLPKLMVPDDWPPVLAASAGFPRLHEVAEVEYFDSLPGSPERLIERIREAELVICSRRACSRHGKPERTISIWQCWT